MKKAVLLLIAVSTLHHTGNAGHPSPANKKDNYFNHTFQTGEKFSTVFSRTIATKSNDFPAVVFRISGTGDYTVTTHDPEHPGFSATFLYDGRAEDKCKVELRDAGKTMVYNGAPYPNTDGSGLTYNPLIWGTPPARLKEGDTWQNAITQAWELGGAGLQTVRVLEVDPIHQTIRLQREGSGEGFFADDQKELEIIKEGKKIRMHVSPGKNHWMGYTTFRNGIVISDELLVTRPLTLTTDSVTYSATQRQYILLNQMP